MLGWGWSCAACDARGNAAGQDDADRLAREHANGCAAVAKRWYDDDVRDAGAEMLELLREMEVQRGNWSSCYLCGAEKHVPDCRLDALLARFPR